jgi:hypothetical protein
LLIVQWVKRRGGTGTSGGTCDSERSERRCPLQEKHFEFNK